MDTVSHDVLDVYSLEGKEMHPSVTAKAAASLLGVSVEEVLFSLDYMEFFLPVGGKAYVVNRRQLAEKLATKSVRGSIAVLMEKAERKRQNAVALYDADGSFCLLSHNAVEAAEKIGAQAAHISRNKKPDFHTHTLVGRYFVRSMLDVFDVETGVKANISLRKLRHGAKHVYVYNYKGEQINRCDGVSGACEDYGLTASPTSRAINQGRPVWVGKELLFFSRENKAVMPLKDNENGHSFKQWKVTTETSDDIILSTTDANEVAEFLSVKKALVYDAVKNYRKIKGMYKVHVTEVVELTPDL